jgi:hypothetical protein
MSTQVAPISQEQFQKWSDAVQEFVNDLYKKPIKGSNYPQR